jgi:hypothetical protein
MRKGDKRRVMNKKNIKRIIAREGLILLGFIGVGLLVWGLGEYLNYKYWHYDVKRIFPNPLTYEQQIGVGLANPYYSVIWLGKYFVIFTYPFSLLIRFIIWAIRTLREKLIKNN